MTNKTVEPLPASTVPTLLRRVKFGELLRSTDLNISSQLILIPSSDDGTISSSSSQHSNSSTGTQPSPVITSSPRLSDCQGGGSSTDQSILNNQSSGNGWPSNYTIMSPWNKELPSPYIHSPWKKLSPAASPLLQYLEVQDRKNSSNNVTHSRSALLIGSLLREDGHVYSLAACGDMLFTGSESKNIRVWKELKDSGGFKSSSGLVKAIIISPAGSSSVRGSSNKEGGGTGNDTDKVVFTGHQDGKIRVWKTGGSANNCSTRRIGSLPTVKDYLKSSMNPRRYIKVRRSKKAPCVRHSDAVSCLCLNTESGLLYSGSWDKTIKVWRLSDYRCLESIPGAHDDAINSIAVSTADGLVFSGSADGTVKVWRRELKGKTASHIYVQTLLSRESAITSLAVRKDSRTVYCGSSDGLVNFWERDKCFWLSYGGVLRGHKMAVLCLATGGGGSLVVSGSADKSICVWRREDEGGIHSCVSVLRGHSGPVKCLAVERGEAEEGLDDDVGRVRSSWIVYSGSLDKSVKVWRVYD